MRRLVVALLVAFLALSVTGCGGGGGGEEAAAPTDAAAPAAPAAPAVSGEAVQEPIADRSAKEGAVFVPFPTGDFVPKDVAGRIESRQPMLIFFYDPQQQTTDDTETEIDSVIEENRGLVDLVSYDMGKYTSVNASGVPVVDDALADNLAAEQAVGLAKELGVTFLPYVVIVDDQGYIIFKSSGPIDRELLERQVQRAVRQ